MPLIMAVIDLDDFKKVNDTYGHRKGDEVLITLADILKRNTPGNENVFPLWRGGICIVVQRSPYRRGGWA